MNKKIKKGFTLVELLVVIAILAILSTVSIVGYTSFIEKANYSVDLQLATQLNSALQIYDGEIRSESDLRAAIEEALGTEGSYGELTAKSSGSGYQIWYDIQEGKVLIAKYEELDDIPAFETATLFSSTESQSADEEEPFWNALYTIKKEHREYLLLGCKNGNDDINKIMNDIETASSSADYISAVEKIKQSDDDLAKKLYENLLKVAVFNDHGIFACLKDVENIYISPSASVLGNTNHNSISLNKIDRIDVPEGVKLGTGSLIAINENAKIYINIKEEQLGEYINASAVGGIIVLPSGDRYKQVGTEFYKLTESGEEKLDGIKSEYTIKMDSFDISAKVDNKVYLSFAKDNDSTLYIADDYTGDITLNINNFIGLNQLGTKVSFTPDNVKVNNTDANKDSESSYNYTLKNLSDGQSITVTAQELTYNIKVVIVKNTSIDIKTLDGNDVTSEGSGADYIPCLTLDYSLNKTYWSLPITVNTNYSTVTPDQSISITDEKGYLTYDNEKHNLCLTESGKSLGGDVDAYYITVKCGNAERKCKVTLLDNNTPAFTVNNDVYSLTKYKNLTFTFGTTGGVTKIKLSDLFKGDSTVISGQKVTFNNSASGSVTLSANEWENYEVDLSKASSNGNLKFTISCRGKSEYVTANIVKGAYNVASENDWKNAPNSTSIVLLKDITIPDTTYTALNSGTGYYSKNIGNKTVYGNLHTIKFGTYLIKVEKQNSYFINGSGCTLTDLLIEGPKYDKAAYGYSSTNAKNGYYVFGAHISGNSTISNCYIAGFNAPIRVDNGTQTFTNTVLKGGALANIYVYNANELKLTNVTTIQYEESGVALGAGIFVDNKASSNVVITANNLKQHNFYTESQIETITKVLSSLNFSTFDTSTFKDLKSGNTYHCAIIVWNEGEVSGFSTNWSNASVNGTPNGYISATYQPRFALRKVTIFGAGTNMPTDTITSYSAQDFLNTQK